MIDAPTDPTKGQILLRTCLWFFVKKGDLLEESCFDLFVYPTLELPNRND